MSQLAGVLLLIVAYISSIYFYRLYFHPLAKFPGPKLAALSKWYEAYYEIVQKGNFVFKIDELHEKYGPIVRVTPDELHVKDSAFWDTLYVRNPKASKYEWTAGRFGNNHSVFTTSDAGLHKLRRGALNNMFSRRAILAFENVVQAKARMLCNGIERCRLDLSICTLSNGFAAFSGDVITHYSFGFSYEHLKTPGFEGNLNSALVAASQSGHVTLQFPWMKLILDILPAQAVIALDPALEKLLQLQKDLRRTLAEIIEARKSGAEMPEHPTIFHHVLNSDLPESEISKDRLGDEAQTVLGGGVITTTWALSIGTYYILSDPDVHSNLLSELREAIPNPAASGAYDYQKLEKLLYLGACIREAIRLALRISGRNARVVHEPLIYKDWTIPPNAAISMSIRDVHMDESIYKDAAKFVPDRWTENRIKLDSAQLEKYFVGFSKGPRSCLGINLAYMELYIVFARIFRKFELELFETDASDVELVHDFFVPCPKLDSKGIRVKVLGLRE